MRNYWIGSIFTHQVAKFFNNFEQYCLKDGTVLTIKFDIKYSEDVLYVAIHRNGSKWNQAYLLSLEYVNPHYPHPYPWLLTYYLDGADKPVRGFAALKDFQAVKEKINELMVFHMGENWNVPI